MSTTFWRAALAAAFFATGLHAAVAAAPAASAPSAPKVLRYAFEIAETSMDPVHISDIYSLALTSHIYESLYSYDHLARPVKIKPLTAAAMPEVSADFKTWTVKIKPGTYFADDPAFKGKKRELTAEDYVYTFKRFADPANVAATWSDLEEQGIAGFNESHEQAIASKTPYDYDRPLEGIRALDRYTLQFKLKEARPRFLEVLAWRELLGAVARDVVEFYGDRLSEHPVGTGPFKLVQWRHSSFIVMERNPGYREVLYDAEPAADDAEGQAILARFKGRRLPMIDRVEVSIIDEQQARWLSFANGEADFLDKLGIQFVKVAIPGGTVAPNMARKGVRAYVSLEPGSSYVFFNMEDRTVGGYTPDNVALRRAIGLGMDTDAEIRLVRNGRAVPAQQLFLPFTSGYDPTLKSEFSSHDPARANALLDLYGYVDKDGDGWRDMPDGSPLVLRLSAQPDSQTRELSDLFRKNMTALKLRTEFIIAKWPENMKSARAGKLMMWSLGGSASRQDGQDALNSFTTQQIVGGGNYARFSRPALDAIAARTQVIADGPERDALFAEANRIALAYMPYKFRVVRTLTDMSYPWLIGYRRAVFWRDWWQYVDIDESMRPAKP